MPEESNWYHASQDSVSRGEGNSAVGLVAYITGEDLKDERTGKWCTRNHAGEVLAWGSVAPSSAAKWLTDPECLGRAWNAVEASETRVNSRIAEHLNVAAKNGFTDQQHMACAHEMAERISKRYGVLVTWGVHKPTDHGDDRNWHYHFGWNERKVEGETFGAKVRELSGRRDIVAAEIIAVRKIVADVTNKYLAVNGFEERVSHLSYRDRGIHKEATRHRGHKANQLELKGERTEVGDHNRDVQRRNAERSAQAEMILNLQSEIVYLEGRRRKHTMDPAEAIDERARARQDNEYKDLIKNKERTDEWFRDWDARNKQSRLDENRMDEAQRERQKAGEFDDPKLRFAQAMRHYDGSPESGLKVFADEYARYRESQNNLLQQIEKAGNPDEKRKLELRHDIQQADYQEIVHQRVAGMSYVITGKRGMIADPENPGEKIETNHQIEWNAANYWKAKGEGLREQYKEHDQAMRENFINTYKQPKPGSEPLGPSESQPEDSAAVVKVREAVRNMTPDQQAADDRRQEKWEHVRAERTQRDSVEEGVAYSRAQARGGPSF